MKKLTLNDLNDDLKKLRKIKEEVDNVEKDLSRIKEMKSIVELRGCTNEYDKSIYLSWYSDFPQKEMKLLVENFFLKKENELLESYKKAISDFKEKYKDIGLDFSEQLKELRIEK